MNKRQRSFLRIIGALIFLISFLIPVYFHYYPQVKETILNANLICNLEVSDINIGEVGQQILDTQDECLKAHNLSLLIKYNWVIYIIGIVLWAVGLWKGLGEKD